jgi:hypothetical protein
MEFLSRHATSACRVVFIPAAVNLLGSPQFYWVPIFLKIFLLRHATFQGSSSSCRRKVNLLLDSLLAWILPFGFWRRPAAKFRCLLRFLSPPIGITAACSLDNS